MTLTPKKIIIAAIVLFVGARYLANRTTGTGAPRRPTGNSADPYGANPQF